MKLKKTLILLLMLIAAEVFVMQLLRIKIAWVFIAAYWLTLTVKNYLDWSDSRGG